MIKWMSEITREQNDPDHIIGGQIWYINKKVNLDKIKNLLNIVGKFLQPMSDKDENVNFSTYDGHEKRERLAAQ